MAWLVMAGPSALFAGLTALLAKRGIKKTDSDVATALRTVAVLLFAWVMTWIVEAGNRRLLAMLLLCDPKGNRQRGGSHRQDEHLGLHRLFLPCVS